MTTIFCLIALGCTACGNKKNPNPHGVCTVFNRTHFLNDKTEPAVEGNSLVTYEGNVKLILNKYCIDCHASSLYNRKGAPTEINYDSYSSSKASAVPAVLTFYSGTMPPSPLPNPEAYLDEICQLQAWIDQGYPP